MNPSHTGLLLLVCYRWCTFEVPPASLLKMVSTATLVANHSSQLLLPQTLWISFLSIQCQRRSHSLSSLSLSLTCLLSLMVPEQHERSSVMDNYSISLPSIKEEHLPLWESKDESSEPLCQTQQTQQQQRRGGIRLFEPSILLLHLLFLVFYTLAFFYLISDHESRSMVVYSPARNILSYLPKTISVLYNDTTNPFLQETGEGVGEAWQSLLQNLNIRLSPEEVRKLGKESVQLDDGSGDYLASLDVYHQLHCLKFLRSYVDEDPLTTIRVQPKNHAYHCIELLRQVIQCHGDVSVLTYDWLPEDKVPMPRWETEHECVDWEALDSWAASRRVNLTSEAMILHHGTG